LEKKTISRRFHNHKTNSNKKGDTMTKPICSNLIKNVLYLSVCIFPTWVFASGETPVSEGLRYITNAMYGGTGVAIATIAVMVVGLLCLGHFLKWATLGYTIIGISIIFGAGSIVNGITSLIHNS
jgi:type IV secretory pathway VirB2 component (pilin)